MNSSLNDNSTHHSRSDEHFVHKVLASEAGLRLDQICAQLLGSKRSRSALKKDIESGRITLNGAQAKPKQVARLGDSISIYIEPQEQAPHQAEALPLAIIYEDRDIVIIDKQAGLTVHPGSGVQSGTLLNALLHYYPANKALPRAGIVHRLDKDTSGLMVVARTERAFNYLTEQIAERKVTRLYLAVAPNVAVLKEFQALDWPIGRDRQNRTRMKAYDHPEPNRALPSNLRSARTDVYKLASSHTLSLLLCKLHSGRTHQIRVHLKKAGAPIIGDATYGGLSGSKLAKALQVESRETINTNLSRQALHAAGLCFSHPRTSQKLSFYSPLADDIQSLLAATSKIFIYPQTFHDLLNVLS